MAEAACLYAEGVSEIVELHQVVAMTGSRSCEMQLRGPFLFSA